MLRAPGSALEFFCIDVDLAELNRAEAELERHRYHLEELVALRTAALAEAREGAEAASRAKSTFLANMIRFHHALHTLWRARQSLRLQGSPTAGG